MQNADETLSAEAGQTNEEIVSESEASPYVDIEVRLPTGKSIEINGVLSNESLSAIKVSLADYQETTFYSSYKLQLRESIDLDGTKFEMPADTNEFVELAVYLTPTIKKCVIDVVYEDYDVKKVRAQVKRTRESIAFPPLNKANYEEGRVQQSVASKAPLSDKAEKAAQNQLKEKIRNALPKTDSFLDPLDLGAFYQETLLRTGKIIETPGKALSDVVKSITTSGWNPPPPARKMQGDLLYLEVATASEGTFHITANARGFYVNKSNRNHFDPLPVANAHHSHELFTTLLGVSAALRNAWAGVSAFSSNFKGEDGALDAIATLYSQGRGDQSTSELQWNTLPNNTFGPESSQTHTYDLYRAQEDASSLFGIEELGAQREWNDEIQALRTVAANDINEKSMVAKLEYKIITEFTEACKQAAVAISEGHITPISYTDPVQSDIYVYNGIFFSKAEDTKDAFKICNGDEAFRKATGRDLQNQKRIQALGIEGVGTVLCTVVDYKGQRFVGQSIIPGIFTQGENSATLMYGLLEKHKPITVNNSTYKLMEQITKTMFIPSRNLSRIPFSHVADEEQAIEETEAANREQMDALNKLLGNLDADQTATIRVDSADSIVAEDATSIPHIGPVEGKFLKGSDGRTYALEIMRLTPLDANYVQSEKGNKKIAAERLAATDKDMSVAYVLRPELVTIFTSRKIQMKRQELMAEAQAAEAQYAKPVSAVLPAKKDETSGGTLTEAMSPPALSNSPEPNSEEQAAVDAKPTMDEETQRRLANEFAAKFQAISIESLGLEINPNVFLPFEVDVDPVVVAKDENTARELAAFLWDVVLPIISKQVREGEFVTKDCDQLVQLLHRMGINMRYLGQLARLAFDEEEGDRILLADGKQRVQAMPQFWLEQLTVEIIARSVKHMLNSYMRKDSNVAAAPAQTIATLLNHLFGALSKREAPVPVSEEAQTESVTGAEDKASVKKNKKKKAAAAAIAAITSAATKLSNNSDVADAAQDATLALLSETIATRFCYNLSFVEPVEGVESTSDNTLAFLRNRISPVTLLRRICQASGVRVVTRSYDFSSTAPFSAEDIAGLVPKAKTCEPDVLLPEFHDMINTSINVMQQGNFGLAYELAQQAYNIMIQIVGNGHQHTATAADQITSVLINAQDFEPAAQWCAKRLTVAVQLQGLDGHDTLAQHLQLANLNLELKESPTAIQHLLSAKYILELTGGPRHVELVPIYARLSLLFEDVGDVDSAFKCLLHARDLNNDILKSTQYLSAIAEFYHRRKRVSEALACQRQVYGVLKELVADDDERVVESKSTLEKYLREHTELIQAAQRAQLAEQQRLANGGAPNTESTGPAEESEETGADGELKKKKRHAHKKSKAKK